MAMPPIIEEWRDVPGLGGRYRVSSLGRAIGPTGVILKDRVTIWGYNRFVAYESGCPRDVSIHQSVCAAWHGPKPTPSHEVNHINCDRLDNRPENLEWVTRQENAAHRVAHGKRGARADNPRAKLSEADVARIRALRADGHTYKQIALKFGVHPNTIGWIITGGTWAPTQAVGG